MKKDGKFEMSTERRYTSGVKIERKEGDGDKSVFRGLASRTEVEYELFRDDSYKERWVEYIEKGAFSDVVNDDVRVLFNHDNNKILARTTSGTAKVWEGPIGLMYEWQNDDGISYARDLERSIERGDVRESSFGFTIKPGGREWVISEDDNGWTTYKHIIKAGGVERLYDVSPVTFPANPNTTVDKKSLRSSMEAWVEEHTEPSGEDGDVKDNSEELTLLERGLKAKQKHLQFENENF